MATKQQKSQTLDYLADKLQQTALYSIQRSDNNSLLIYETVSGEAKKYSIIIPNFFPSVSDFKDHLVQNRNMGIYTAPVFYKDGKTAFALLRDTPKFWKHTHTLKQYTDEQKHSMLNIRDMERKVLEIFGKDVTYYQPQTARLAESVRVFALDDVYLDYNHIPPEDPKYDHVQNRISLYNKSLVEQPTLALDYKLPVEKPTLGPALALEVYSNNDPYKRARLVGMEPMTEDLWEEMHPSMDRITAELQAAAQHAYPGLPPEDAYRMYLGGEDQ